MKICDLTQSYSPTGGGVRTYLHAKREHIREHPEYEHQLIVPGVEDTVRREGRLTTYTIASPPVPGSPTYRLLLRSDKVLRILRDVLPDVVELHCAYNLPWTAFYHRRQHPCRIVAIYHTDVPTAYVEPAVTLIAGKVVGRKAKAAAAHYLRALYNRCDATIAISPGMVEKLSDIGVREVVRVPLGVELEVFHPAKRDLETRKHLGAGKDEVLLVYAGRLDGEKRAHIVVDAFERLPEGFRGVLVLVGEGPLRAELEARAPRNGRIRVLPFQTEREVLARILASADVYVSAMPYETFGLSVIEAQACALPVIGVRAGAMVDRVPPGTGLLGAVDSAEEMARNIVSLSSEERQRMGRAARALVEENFSWHRTFERIFALYERLPARRTPGPSAS